MAKSVIGMFSWLTNWLTKFVSREFDHTHDSVVKITKVCGFQNSYCVTITDYATNSVPVTDFWCDSLQSPEFEVFVKTCFVHIFRKTYRYHD